MPSASASHRSMPCSSRLKNGWRSADATSRRRSQAGAVISAVPIHRQAQPGGHRHGQLQDGPVAPAVGRSGARAGRASAGASSTDGRARMLPELPPGQAQRPHHRRLGQVVGDRRETPTSRRRSRARTADRSARPRSRSRARGSPTGARAGAGGDRRVGAIDLLGDARRAAGGSDRRGGRSCGWPARARRRPARASSRRPSAILLEVAPDHEEGGPDAVAGEQLGEAGQAAAQDRRSGPASGGAPGRAWMRK